MPRRNPGAPRLIDWTGERCVPWGPNIQVLYEHFHRYLWAQPLVAGRRVLELGSGEGFGAALLAETATEVVGIDIDLQTVEHSRLNYAGEGLTFQIGSATDLSDFADASFDAVVALELIEHLTDQESVLSECVRVLRPDGLLLMSTPDRELYSEANGYTNPFHERELNRQEFEHLIGTYFPAMALFGQGTVTGSRIEALASLNRSGRHLPLQIERSGEDWEAGMPPKQQYMIAVAAKASLPEMPSESTLSDYGLSLVRAVEATAHEAVVDARAELSAVQERLMSERESERQRLAGEIVAARRGTEDLRQVLREAQTTIAGFEHSVTWKLLERARERLYGVIDRESLPGRGVSGTLRVVGRMMDRHAESADPAQRVFEPIALPWLGEPQVSIVIPVYSGAELTERCLRAISLSGDTMSYEVILVDDDADAETKALLGFVEGARVVVNESNLGYLHSVNRGAAEARGRFLVLLNNDTEPQAGWLDALVSRARSADDVGAVAAKLVNPDGTLQEAGSIVWRDGKVENYGRGADPGAPEYQHVREVDYGSAAALLVRSELWEAAGGFDERYAPGYFEDTDLCFRARELGWRVLYEPLAVVMHVEGGTMGTDLAEGGKRNQALNHPKFLERWRHEIKRQPGHPSPERRHLASDRRPGPSVLIVDHRVPMPDRDAGSVRMWEMIEGLLTIGCQVTFLPDDQGCPQPYTTQLRGLGVEVLDGQVPVPAWIAALAPNLQLAILSRPYVAARYMHLVREHAPGALLAYDTVDLHFLREERRANAGHGSSVLAAGFRELELALARASDVTLVVSEEERGHLLDVVPTATTEVVPMANRINREVPGPEGRSGVIFVGGFEHAPNIDAAIALGHDVMPRVWRELEGVLLTIVGGKVPPEVRSLAAPGIDVAGWVPDLEPLLMESVALAAPLAFGAGMKGKVTQALAAGLPVVTTEVGAEGLGATAGEELFIVKDPDEFAECILTLHRDPDTWRRLSANGQLLAERVCSPELQREALRRLLTIRRRRGAMSATALGGGAKSTQAW